jgi:hypothetical protein
VFFLDFPLHRTSQQLVACRSESVTAVATSKIKS